MSWCAEKMQHGIEQFRYEEYTGICQKNAHDQQKRHDQ